MQQDLRTGVEELTQDELDQLSQSFPHPAEGPWPLEEVLPEVTSPQAIRHNRIKKQRANCYGLAYGEGTWRGEGQHHIQQCAPASARSFDPFVDEGRNLWPLASASLQELQQQPWLDMARSGVIDSSGRTDPDSHGAHGDAPSSPQARRMRQSKACRQRQRSLPCDWAASTSPPLDCDTQSRLISKGGLDQSELDAVAGLAPVATRTPSPGSSGSPLPSPSTCCSSRMILPTVPSAGLSQAQLDAVSWSPVDPVDDWRAATLLVGSNARCDEASAVEQAWWVQQGEEAEAPSSPQAEQLCRARRMQQSQQQEEPSSPQAAWLRKAKQVHQRYSDSSSTLTSPQRDGLGQSELDMLGCEPPEEEALRPGEPSSPQAGQLLRLKRHQGRGALSSGAVPAPPHADAAAGGPVRAWQAAQEVQAALVTQTGEAPRQYMQTWPQLQPQGEASPFFPGSGEEAAWPPLESAADGESSPQASHLRMAKVARQAAAQQMQQVGLPPGPSEARRPAQEPWLHPLGDDPTGLSQAELNTLSEEASPNAARPAATGHDGHCFSPDDPASPMAARMQHAKKMARYAGSAACPGL